MSRSLLAITLTLFLVVAPFSASSSNAGFEKQKNAAGMENKIPLAAKAILEQADEFELLSLAPRLLREPGKGTFHGYKVLGSTQVRDAGTRGRLVTALEKGIAANEGTIGACFNPRHGIHVKKGKEYADFVICFECLQIEIYGTAQGRVLTMGSPQGIFNQVLKDAKVPLSHE